MHHSAHVDHARHDPTLIAGHAAGDLSNVDTAAAAALLSSCSNCAELHRDLVAISTATRALPHAARAPRDFRLTAEQADRLRRGSWLRTLLRRFASARSATRPAAAAFTSVGVAGVLVAVLLPAVVGGLGGPASAPAERDTGVGAPAATSAPAMAPGTPEFDGAGGPVPGAAGGPTDGTDFQNAQATELTVLANGGTATDDGTAEINGDLQSKAEEDLVATAGSNPILVGSLALLAIGLALYGLRLAGRRVR
jgi:hypothetical protein